MDDELRMPVQQPCCDAWRKAHEWETDNEMYQSLVRYQSEMVPSGERGSDPEREEPIVGVGLPAVKFCPWCAAPKSPKVWTQP